MNNVKYINFIGMYDSVFSDGFCSHLINSFENLISNGLCRNRKQFENVSKSKKDDISYCIDLNNHTEIGSYDGQGIRDIIVRGVQDCYDAYVEEYDILETSSINCTSFKLQKTNPGAGYHVWHAEQNNGTLSNRGLFYIIYLNDIDSAGETEFLYQQIRIPPKENTCIISPAAFTHTHRGNTVHGEKAKYVITGWFYYN